MSSLTLRHYKSTYAYRSGKFDRRLRDLNKVLRTRLSRRRIKRQLKNLYAHVS